MALGENKNGLIATSAASSVKQTITTNNEQQQQQQQHQSDCKILSKTMTDDTTIVVNGGKNENNSSTIIKNEDAGTIVAANDKATKQSKQGEINTAFLRAARAGDLDKLVEFLSTGEVSDINASNPNGLNALHLAAKDGHINVVRELIKRGANVDNTTRKGNSALHIASLAGQRDIIKILIQNDSNVNLQSQNGFTPLYMAAQENHDQCVKYLLTKGANQTLATEDGFTPLAVAMQQGHDKVVAVLLENDLRGKVRLPALHIAAKKDDVRAATLLLQNEHNPDIASKSGFTPLHIAAHYGNINIATLLIEQGANVNYTAKHNITPLHVACKWGKIFMVNLLITNHANINSITRDGLTPLHCAARSGHDNVIDCLIENHANILAKTKNGLAPLHMAAQGEHINAARILLFHKAPVDDITIDYLTALHVAAHCGHINVAKLLLDRNANPNARALNGFTPLHIACKKNRIKIVELLLKYGAMKCATTESGLTPLHVASFMGCMNIVIYLLQYDAKPDIQTVRGETSLHLAARANQTDIIRILLRNGAQVDAKAREEQTPLHVASRLGNIDIVMLLLQHGANVDSITKDFYTPLHIAAKEGQDEVAAILIDNGAKLDAITKKGFTPLHLAGKYGHQNVAELLIQKGATIDASGKNGVTPLHVAAHYDNQTIALLLLEKGAATNLSAKNGHTPLHIAAKKNQMDIATTLLEYGANVDAESKSGFTPIHLSAQEGHIDMSQLLLAHKANPNLSAKNGLTPLHLCAQEDKVDVAKILLNKNDVTAATTTTTTTIAKIDAKTKAGYTPLHVAAHFGQINMVKYLLENDAPIETCTNIGYTALHQAAQQGHTLIINLLLKHKANPNALTNNGQTALNIANKLGYITVVESLKVVTETTSTITTGTMEEKYRVVAPESMHETFMSDSEDEGGGNQDSCKDDAMTIHGKAKPPIYMSYYQNHRNVQQSEDPVMCDQQQYKYMTVDDIKGLDDNIKLDTNEDKVEKGAVNELLVKENVSVTDSPLFPKILDNVDIVRQPIHAGKSLTSDILNTLEPHLDNFGGRNRKSTPMCRERFLVSFLVDARGGAMRGCRHSGVRVIVPPRSASQPTRITCRYVKPLRIPNPPPLMEGEALVSRILELTPVGAKFLGPVILEVPHFASLRDKEREIIILRSDNGETWREHTLTDNEEAIQDVLNDSFELNELNQLDDLHTNRIIRIVIHDFPHYIAVISRIRQEIHVIGSDGGTLSSIAVPQVQAIFPPNALTKKIRVGLQAQPINLNNITKLIGHSVAVSSVVTVEPRRRKFHKAITLNMPAPKTHTKGMINQYHQQIDDTSTKITTSTSNAANNAATTLRLLCSITGGQNRAIWEDVTGSTPLTFINDCVSFTTTVSARFWLMDIRNISDACKIATELYTFMSYVPFMCKFVIYCKRTDVTEAKLSIFCMTDDREDKTLEQHENFIEIAKSRDVEVLEGRKVYLEFGGNIIPIIQKSDDGTQQLFMNFIAFKENRLTFAIKIKENDDMFGRITFMNEPKVPKGEPHSQPICSLNVALPLFNSAAGAGGAEQQPQKKYDEIMKSNINDTFGDLIDDDEIHKADIRLSDICNLLDTDWDKLAIELDIPLDDINLIKCEYPNKSSHQAMVMLRLWLRQSGNKATGNNLEQALHRINRSDIVEQCIFNMELVTDEMEKTVAKMQLDQSGFDHLKDELNATITSTTTDTILNEKQNEHSLEIDNGISLNLEKMVDNMIATAAPTAEPEKTDLSIQQQQITDNDIEMPSNNIDTSAAVIDENLKTDIDPSKNVVIEDEHFESVLNEFDRTLDCLPTTLQSNLTDVKSKIIVESKIPVTSSKTSTPIKIKTIKKHSKVNRDLAKQAAIQQRPTVGDIEWTPPLPSLSAAPSSSYNNQPTQITEISTLNLEDVTSPSEHQSFEPVVILSPSDDYSGEIDEVILVQTLADDIDADDDNDFIVNNAKISSTNVTNKINTTAAKTGAITLSSDDLQTTSFSLNSESDSDSRIESPYHLSKINYGDTIDDNRCTDSGGGVGGNGNGSHDVGDNCGGGIGEKTIGSSSESDVALHEAGAELSDDEPETDIYQSNEHPSTFTQQHTTSGFAESTETTLGATAAKNDLHNEDVNVTTTAARQIVANDDGNAGNNAQYIEHERSNFTSTSNNELINFLDEQRKHAS